MVQQNVAQYLLKNTTQIRSNYLGLGVWFFNKNENKKYHTVRTVPKS